MSFPLYREWSFGGRHRALNIVTYSICVCCLNHNPPSQEVSAAWSATNARQVYRAFPCREDRHGAWRQWSCSLGVGLVGVLFARAAGRRSGSRAPPSVRTIGNCLMWSLISLNETISLTRTRRSSTSLSCFGKNTQTRSELFCQQHRLNLMTERPYLL